MAFEPGKSGNPGGRPKENNEVKQLAREYTVESVEKLVHWMRSDNAKASVSACSVILDRGWGKPAQAHTGADGESAIQHVHRLEVLIIDSANPPA